MTDKWNYYMTYNNFSTFNTICELLSQHDLLPEKLHVLVVPMKLGSGQLRRLFELKRAGEFNLRKFELVLMYDSGGYEVQIGELTFVDLLVKLQRIYETQELADYLVLPDNPPKSEDDDDTVMRKVEESLEGSLYFVRKFPELIDRFIGVAHGRKPETVVESAKVLYDAGIRYIGFGSFDTTGASGGINTLTPASLERLIALNEFLVEKNLKLHIFGIGSIPQLWQIKSAGIEATSVDSAKAARSGGNARVFFPEFTVNVTFEYVLTHADEYYEMRQRSSHKCVFCEDLVTLTANREYRIAHNCLVLLESIEKFRNVHFDFDKQAPMTEIKVPLVSKSLVTRAKMNVKTVKLTRRAINRYEVSV